MNYIYKITCLANGRMYIGQRKYAGDPFEDDYFGSSGNPDFYADLKLYPNIYIDWQKEILEIVDGDKKFLDDRETYWIQQYWDNNHLCYNISKVGSACRCNEYCKERGIGIYGFTPEKTKEVAQKGGRAGGKVGGKKSAAVQKELGIGIYGMTSEEKSEAGKKGGKIAGNNNKENHKGYCGMTYEERKAAADKGNAIQKELGIGRYDSELQSELGKRGSAKAKELGVGAFFDKEIQSKAGKKGAAVNKENKTGFFSSETQSKGGKKSAESKRKSGAMSAGSDMQKKATATRNIRYAWYLDGVMVYVGRSCDAKEMMHQRNQVWDHNEDEPISKEMFEYLKTNKEWFEANRYWYHPSASTPMTNGVKIIKCQMVKKLVNSGKSTWEEWTLTEFNS